MKKKCGFSPLFLAFFETNPLLLQSNFLAIDFTLSHCLNLQSNFILRFIQFLIFKIHYGSSYFLRIPLVFVFVHADFFLAPLRITSDVYNEQILGEVFLCSNLDFPRLLVSKPLCVWDFTPLAPCLRRYRKRSTLS